MRKLVTIILVVSFIFRCCSSAFAAKQPWSAKQIPSAEEIALMVKQTAIAEWAKVAKMKVRADPKSAFASRGVGVYPTRKGVILVTADYYKGLIPTGHAAIIYDSKTVVESVAEGVIFGNNDWNKTKYTCYGVTVISTTNDQDSKAADWCKTHLGKPYNYNYFDTSTRKSFYCSQLIWASYLENFKIDLNTLAFWIPFVGNAIHPVELVTTDKTCLVYSK